MKPIDAWNLLKQSEKELRRWTQSGATGKAFTFRIRDAGRGESIGFIRNGVEVKSASFSRFSQFHEAWLAGTKSPDAFRNDGEAGTVAEVIYFLIPVFEWLEQQPSQRKTSGDTHS